MTQSKLPARRKYALTVFVYAGAILFALVLLVGPSADRGARLAMAGLGLLAMIFGILRPSGFLEDDYPRRAPEGWRLRGPRAGHRGGRRAGAPSCDPLRAHGPARAAAVRTGEG